MILGLILAAMVSVTFNVNDVMDSSGLCDLNKEEFSLLSRYDVETLNKVKDGTIKCDDVGDSIDFGAYYDRE